MRTISKCGSRAPKLVYSDSCAAVVGHTIEPEWKYAWLVRFWPSNSDAGGTRLLGCVCLTGGKPVSDAAVTPPVSDSIPILIQHSGTPRGGGVGKRALGVPLALEYEGELTYIPACC